MRLEDYGSWSIYDEIRAHKSDYNMNNSAEWFMQNVRNFSNVPGLGPMRMLGDHLDRQTKAVEIGNMYMFTYYPIHYDTLPMYDKFPLCIPFSKHGKYFTGLNLHYLHPKTRLILLDKLLALSTHKTLNERAKLAVTWRLLRSAAKFPEVAPCVKMYHVGHVKSMYLRVPPKDWVMAIFLPLERFVKKNNNQVWDISKKMIGKK